MTVAELIKRLEKEDPDIEILNSEGYVLGYIGPGFWSNSENYILYDNGYAEDLEVIEAAEGEAILVFNFET